MNFTKKKNNTQSLSRVSINYLVAAGLLVLPLAGYAQSDDSGLAQELTNPVADLITLPIQMNFDRDYGLADDGKKMTTNLQPVIPFGVNENWNLITRTIVPIIDQDNIPSGSGSEFGLGDINLSLFMSPKKPTDGGITWGAGGVFLLPTATDRLLGTDKWGAGPSMVALALRGPWTVGILANHLWSFAGDSDRPDISNSFLQPFVAYTTPGAWTVSALTESTYNWKTEQWSVPVNVALSKLVKFGKLPVSLQAGVGYWAESPAAGPEGMRYRLQANIVLPKSR